MSAAIAEQHKGIAKMPLRPSPMCSEQATLPCVASLSGDLSYIRHGV